MEKMPDMNELVDVDSNELVDIPQEEMPSAESLVEEPEMTGSQARKSGFIEGLTFSQSAELAAIPETAKDVFEALGEAYAKDGIMGTVNVFPSILETHRQNTQIEQEALDKLESKYPLQYAASEMLGGALSEAAVIALPSMIGAAPLTLSGMLSAHFGVNFAHGLGKADNPTLAENINEAIEAGGIGAGLPIWAQKGVQSIARYGTKVAKAGGKALTDKGIIDNKKFVKKGMLSFLGLGEETTGLAAEQYGKEIDDMLYRVAAYTDDAGQPLIKPNDTRLDTLKRFSIERKIEGDRMGDMLLSLGEGTGGKNLSSMFERIDDAIFQGRTGLLNKADLAEREAASRARTSLKSLFFKKNPDTGRYDPDFPNEKFNPYYLHDYMSSAYKQSRSIDKARMKGTVIDPIDGVYHNTKKRIADMLWGDLEDMVRGTDIQDAYKASKARYGDLRIVEDQLRATFKPNSKGSNFITSLVNKRLIQSNSALTLMTGASAAGAGYAQNNKPLMYASLMAMGLKAVYENPRVNGLLATTARNVGEEFKRNPDKYNKIAGLMISSLKRGGDEMFVDQLGVASATIELSNRPLARTTQDVYTKQDSILTLVNEMDSEVAKNLKEAINIGDEQTIAGIMVSLAPKAPKGLIEPGVGWDGRAITPEDKTAVLSKLKTLSPRQRQMLIPKFESDGIIPEEYYNEVNPKPVNVMQHVKKQRQGRTKKADY